MRWFEYADTKSPGLDNNKNEKNNRQKISFGPWAIINWSIIGIGEEFANNLRQTDLIWCLLQGD